MERKSRVKRRKKKQKSFLPIAVLLLFLGGSATFIFAFKEDYSFGKRMMYLEEESYRASLFAEELCVVEDENGSVEDGIAAKAAAVFNITDREVVYSKNVFEKLNPASITKVMTALMVLKYGDLSDVVTITKDVLNLEAGSSLCYIAPGDQITLEQLLYGLLIPSGNDAAIAIALHMSGSEEAFSEWMNEEMKELGATSTNFNNSHGLTEEDHYTTVYDLYLIFQEAFKYEVFREILGANSYTASFLNKKGETVIRKWDNTNRYMTGEYALPDGFQMLGGKTGTTKAAGYCLIMGSEDEEGKEYISVVLNSDSRMRLYDNMTNMIDKVPR